MTEVQTTVSLLQRQAYIKAFPCFARLLSTQTQMLAELMTEVVLEAQDIIVKEDELVDCIFIIVEGQAEVTHLTLQGRKKLSIPVAVLHEGESVGLNDTGFYSTTGKRTATVTALTSMRLLRLDLKDLHAFLKTHQLETSMYAASQQMLRMRFIKQSLPFAKLSFSRLQWLAEHVEDWNVPAGIIIFNQGDVGDKCYLIRSGKVEIFIIDENGNEQILAQLKSPVLFGEATLITHTARNATARTIEATELLVLNYEHLSELLESENAVATMFMSLMVDRSRPMQNPHVSLHHRLTADGQEITILKNPDNTHYFKLSKEGAYIWTLLDGKHTMQDITLSLAQEYNIFAPNVVAALISKLCKAGFICNLQIPTSKTVQPKPLWTRAIASLKQLAERRFAIGDADAWITSAYQGFIRYFFTKPAQTIFGILAVLGFLAFVVTTPDILAFFSAKHVSWLLILTLIPLSIVGIILHELGHAFAVKAFGREVHYIGIGWNWLMPVAFTDTSDMWLATRKPRMLVNFAGVYVDVLLAGIASLLIIAIPNWYIQGMLWLFALYTYISAFRMLSPLQELDGYYILMDWLEKNRLRQCAVLWLVKELPHTYRHPGVLKKHKAEVGYWLACLIYIICISVLTLAVQAFVFAVIGITPPNPYVTLIIPFLVVIFSTLNIMADIKNQAEED